MDIIFWRHAEAHEAVLDQSDLSRMLTPRGEKQAARMAAWLDRQLPASTRVLVSPARRTQQTAAALPRRSLTCPELAPGASVADVLLAAGWPQGRAPVLIVGHQPTLGQCIAELLGMHGGDCSVKKGAVWWLRQRERDGHAQTVLLSVQSPDLL